jgi:phosphoglycolate phosphatase
MIANSWVRPLPPNACRFHNCAPSPAAMTAIRFKIVGFDLDGTLLDTSQDLGAALNHALGTLDRPVVPLDRVVQLIGGGAKAMLRRGLELTGGVEGVDLEALFQILLDYYEAHIAVHTALFPGGATMLDTLEAAGIHMAVVTNKRQFMADKLLKELGLRHRFRTVIGGGAGFPLKPAPDVLHAMVDRLGGGPAAYVGDSTFDTGAAKAAGLPSVAVSFGFNDLPADQLGAQAVIDHFDGLAHALSQI